MVIFPPVKSSLATVRFPGLELDSAFLLCAA